MVSCSTTTIGKESLHFFTVWTLQSSINSNLWSHNENISEFRGFPIACYNHHMDSFLCTNSNRLWYPIVQSLFGENYYISLQFRNFNHLSIAIYDPKMRGFPIAWYSHPIHSFSPQIVIDDGILLYNHYWKRAIEFLNSLDTSIIDQ
jgi:hypothetical protein